MLLHPTPLRPPRGSTPRRQRNLVEVGGGFSGFDILTCCISSLVSCIVASLIANPGLCPTIHGDIRTSHFHRTSCSLERRLSLPSMYCLAFLRSLVAVPLARLDPVSQHLDRIRWYILRVCAVSSDTSYLQLSSSTSRYLPGNPKRLAQDAVETAKVIARSIRPRHYDALAAGV
jgi:hypothetical protein